VLPPALLRGGLETERVGVVPDAVLTLPAQFPHDRTSRRPAQMHGATRDFLLDVKNLHDVVLPGPAGQRDGRGSAVTARAMRVHREYELAAMHLDEQHHGVVLQRGARRMLQPVGGPGPVQRLLQTYPRVRGLAFGPRAESNADVGCLIQYAAGRRADRDWRGMGARSASEARSYVSEHLRRTISMGVCVAC
jgi:hypothetical protein